MKPQVIGVRVDPTSYAQATAQITAWAKAGQARGVYATSVHGIIQAQDDPGFREILRRADLVTPDGMPLVWVLRLKGFKGQRRVYGPNLTLLLLAAAAEEGIPVGFYGGTPQVLETLCQRMSAQFPGLKIVYAFSPPFRHLEAQEEADVVARVNEAGTRLLFVGLGCPKQEAWIDAHLGRIPAVLLGVGAAFDFLAGVKRQAPSWMQRLGLEWLFRLGQEPGRLWKRYFHNNPRFLLLAARDLLHTRKE